MKSTKEYLEMNNLKNITLLLISLIAIYFAACGDEAEIEKKESVVHVQTAEVRHEAIAVPIHTSGKLYSGSEIKLSFKTGGIIEQIDLVEGQSVKKGKLLAKLNLSEIESRVQLAREGVEKAERDLERGKKLYADSVATLEQLQNLTTAHEVAKANLKIAEFNLNNSTIYAPENGIILKRLGEAGEMTGPGNPAILFGSEESGWIVRSGISDKDIMKISIGDSAAVQFDSHPGILFNGKISEIGGAANPYTGTFEVEVELAKTNLFLASGLVAKLDLFPSKKYPVTTIPINSVFEVGGKNGTVFTIDPVSKTAKKISVTIMEILEDKIVVGSGLENVELVTTVGTEYLSEGVRVETETGYGKPEAGI